MRKIEWTTANIAKVMIAVLLPIVYILAMYRLFQFTG